MKVDEGCTRRGPLSPKAMRFMGLAILGLWLAACVGLRTPQTVTAGPQIADAEYVGNDACVLCHAEQAATYPESPHGRLHLGKQSSAETGCESCHGAGSRHVANPTVLGSIVNPRNDAAACLACHVGVDAAFRHQHSHPVTSGVLNCADCHDPHGRTIAKSADAQLSLHADPSCASCHQRQASPKVFAHEALREGCTACHVPHGGIHRAMLQTPDANLCLRCHAQVAAPTVAGDDLFIGKRSHRFDVRDTTCWVSGCHTAVHGSNAHPKLLY